jgi:hypothetical protein
METRYHTWFFGCDTDGMLESPASWDTQLWRGVAVAFAKSLWRWYPARAGCQALRDHQPNPLLYCKGPQAVCQKWRVKTRGSKRLKYSAECREDTRRGVWETPHQGSGCQHSLHGPLQLTARPFSSQSRRSRGREGPEKRRRGRHCGPTSSPHPRPPLRFLAISA